MPKVNIVIPIYNNWELTHKLLWSLYRHERKNIHHVYVVDDCSTDEEVQAGLKWWKAEWKEKADPMPITVTRTKENLGFLLASNLGLTDLNGLDITEDEDIMILLSNDVLIHGKFIDQIKEILEADPKSLVGGILYTHDTGWNKFGDKLFPYLEGWLLATSAKAWHELDYFDEQYAPSDYEDVDLSTKAIDKKYELVPLNNIGISHIGGQSIGYNPTRLERTNLNKKKFEDKWIK